MESNTQSWLGSIKEALFEMSVLLEEYTEQDIEAAQKFGETELKKLFPENDFVVQVGVGKILGRIFMVSVYGKKTSKVTKHNSPSRLEYMWQIGKPTEKPAFEVQGLAYELKNLGVKPRKVSAATPLDALKKIVEFYKKNADTMKKIEAEKLAKGV